MSARGERISLDELRRFVVGGQGLEEPRRRGDVAAVERAVRRLSCVQLDPLAVVERSERIVISSRIGPFPADGVTRLLESGKLFEYWAHEASLMPIEHYPLARRRMAEGGNLRNKWYPRVLAQRKLVERALAEIRERGPLSSRHFEAGPPDLAAGAKRILEALWNGGVLAVASRDGAQRLYDLGERVIPKEQLEAEVPDEHDYLRESIAIAVRARGALTVAGMIDHFRLRGGTARTREVARQLAEAGELRELEVDDGGPPVFVDAAARLEVDEPRAAVFLSPFENMLWDRAFTNRLFGFDHVIEIYKPASKRTFGYYVLPLLSGSQIIGRADLAADRKTGALRVLAFHPHGDAKEAESALEPAAARLAAAIGVERVER